MSQNLKPVTWEEAVANSGRYAWEIDANGERKGYGNNWGQPFMWKHFDKSYPAIRWCNGVSEGMQLMEGLTLEWECETS
jgi:hypothetical protein